MRKLILNWVLVFSTLAVGCETSARRVGDFNSLDQNTNAEVHGLYLGVVTHQFSDDFEQLVVTGASMRDRLKSEFSLGSCSI